MINIVDCNIRIGGADGSIVASIVINHHHECGRRSLRGMRDCIIAHGISGGKGIDVCIAIRSGRDDVTSCPFAVDDIAVQRDSLRESVPSRIDIGETYGKRKCFTFINGQRIRYNGNRRGVIDGIDRHVNRTIHIGIRDARERSRIINGKITIVVFCGRIDDLAAFDGDRAGRLIAHGCSREFNSVRRNQFGFLDIPHMSGEEVGVRCGDRYRGGVFVQFDLRAIVRRETIRITEKVEA